MSVKRKKRPQRLDMDIICHTLYIEIRNQTAVSEFNILDRKLATTFRLSRVTAAP